MAILIGVITGFLYLYLMNKLVDISMDFFEKKGVKDHCLKVLPSLSFIFLTSLLIGFYLPEPIKEYTGVFRIFTYFSGVGLLLILFSFIIVKPICPSWYKKLFE
ncbi:hypothetical protein ACFVSW_26320 [Neobacillus sp. NPDC058068]|uniref:hypothetical protein n=1 Tax=Neobacillus sp. NPDC058068 TaxID=3346325 RepID=UPI0036D7ADE0